ncbi:hypothetical protein R1sor_002019 [Riccia sorocarpa]|uniref:Reverse transcriptase domain-containing protein n=1 Tax=Riccia sorocarpa TaxID=122646 RepID=A0ABD3H051_9MARC
MPFPFKLLAKIMANCMQTLILKLIDSQKSGFVVGRNIRYIVLVLKIGLKWAEQSNQETIFLILDFLTAYDRVEFKYIRETLKAMGFGDDTIKRIKGLARNGTSIMMISREDEGENKREFLVTDPCHQKRFVDDIGICIIVEDGFFQAIKEVDKKYEAISGARLNLQESLVMSLTPKAGCEWKANTGCRIAEPGESFINLGVKTRCTLDEKDVVGKKRLYGGIPNEEGDGGSNWIPLKGKGVALQMRDVAQILGDKDIK